MTIDDVKALIGNDLVELNNQLISVDETRALLAEAIAQKAAAVALLDSLDGQEE